MQCRLTELFLFSQRCKSPPLVSPYPRDRESRRDGVRGQSFSSIFPIVWLSHGDSRETGSLYGETSFISLQIFLNPSPAGLGLHGSLQVNIGMEKFMLPNGFKSAQDQWQPIVMVEARSPSCFFLNFCNDLSLFLNFVLWRAASLLGSLLLALTLLQRPSTSMN